MSKKKHRLMRLAEPGMRGYFAAFSFYCAAGLAAAIWGSALLSIVLAVAGMVAVALLYFIFRREARRRRRDIMRFVDSAAAGADIVKSSVMDSFFPVAVVRLGNGEIIWSNNSFAELSGGRHSFDRRLGAIMPDFDLSWLTEGHNMSPSPVCIDERWYNVYGSTEQAAGGHGNTGALYFIDCTEYRHMRQKLDEVRPVVGILVIDAYDEITKNLNDTQKSGVLADIDSALGEWTGGKNCILRRFDRDKYFLFCPQDVLDAFIEERFKILDMVHSIVSRDIPVTLSIGFGVEGRFDDMYSDATLAIDMALSRGGDQAVIKDKINFAFYGGHSQELEKRTKVKSRVMANALRRLILDSSDVFVMGHKNSDLDSVGSAAGIVCACRTLGRSAYIVLNRERTAAEAIIERLEADDKYDGVFISPSDAMIRIGPSSLLVVVDTNRPEVVESPELLESCYRVAVVDHHRRAASYIENAALSLHEPYASSASELVCEMLGYMDISTPLLRCEADALLGGIVLDTKNFSIRTGVRTFEAAATLRHAGADPIEIKRLFQTDYDHYMARYRITARASIHRGVAVAMVEEQVDRIIAAQAADELLTVNGIQASCVLFPEKTQNGTVIVISARSLGTVNVQVILEKLGGGGHLNMAGAQIADSTLEDVLAQLYTVLDEYIDEMEKKAT